MTAAPVAASAVAAEASRRRTFAVISHPDAGKSTLTEALALHARVIGNAGAVHGKGGRRGVVSDWMEMEQARGISITSAALQFEYGDNVINLLDTPGHADFSEDTYRVLAAVDCAVMLLDAAKGLEPQTLKLFDVCRHRGIPVLTFVNKWDRPGLDALAICDQLEERIGLRPTPLTWPVGESGHFRGLLDRRSGEMAVFERAPGGVRISAERRLTPDEAAETYDGEWHTALEEVQLLDHVDEASFRAGRTTPLLFGAAVNNIGVGHLLQTLVELAPPPSARPDASGELRDVDEPFSGLVFKVQAGMDKAHRDRVAFVRVCSGRFERGAVVTHAATGRPFATKYAQALFGRDRDTVEIAYPGDIIGLVNASALRPGDTLHAREAPVEFAGMPSFAPEHFAVCRARDTGRSKQFRRGIQQLEHEGVVQVLRSELRGDAAPILAAVGPLQFDVSAHRLEHEFGSAVRLDRLPYSLARRTRADDRATLDAEHDVEVVERGDGALLALFSDRWRLASVQRRHPELMLEPLVAGADVEA
ncbi:peptide chain release factor 3 [Actinobacteria bacterium YIM 96077]|uniref:Peptide chain release factor 3 n=1 Tax=Phytoactinopolyspora halophila TaxID=1981511 RepID=A0A329R1Z0_9ACTN|nr:peptide chain release factor 3 [Phytoactinopolyspora halophila]AYY12120.1 peptide chain release factor 3 [Actinobacteria bacterium YIM 96077]RAW18645.1 peptide chain release factor 3 [Phytoactinopolyspora halophila]